MNERYIIMHSVYPNYLLFFKKKNKLFCIGETKDIVDLFGMNIVKTVNTIIVDNLNIIDKKEVLNNQYELLCTKVKMINFFKNLDKWNERIIMDSNDQAQEYLRLYKNKGKFYCATGIDAYILNHFFDYKIIDNNRVGFPENVIEKVLQKLEDEKISYQVFNFDEQFRIKDYKKINRYNKLAELVQQELDLNKRLDIILEKIKNCDKEKILEIIERIESCII